MSSVLFVWELGGGLGHIMQLQPLVDHLCRQGHQVSLALRDLSRTREVFAAQDVTYFQAPLQTRSPRPVFPTPSSFAQLLYNLGFGNVDELSAMADAWSSLYQATKPDMIIFDHSPTALLSARGYDVKRVVIGSGFCCPPDESPLPNLRPWGKSSPDELSRTEDQVRDNINKVLFSRDAQPVERVTQIYGDVDETFLVTFKELDHYPNRSSAKYWGPDTRCHGKRPEWPPGAGSRIYAYLKLFPALPGLLRVLKELGNPTIILGDGLPGEVTARFAGVTNLSFETSRLDVNAVARECDLAILNANHGTTAAMLLAGKPIFQLPIYLEQTLLARAVRQMGATRDASIRDPRQIDLVIKGMLRTDRFSQAAEAFADQHATYDLKSEHERIFDRLDQLLARGEAWASGAGD